jgi:hypothetical protein
VIQTWDVETAIQIKERVQSRNSEWGEMGKEGQGKSEETFSPLAPTGKGDHYIYKIQLSFLCPICP